MGLEKINIIRKEKGISNEELSRISGIPMGTLSKITAGITKDPKLETVKSIARALDVSLNVFDDRENSPVFNQKDELLIRKYYRLSKDNQRTIDDLLDSLYKRQNVKYDDDIKMEGKAARGDAELEFNPGGAQRLKQDFEGYSDKDYPDL